MTHRFSKSDSEEVTVIGVLVYLCFRISKNYHQWSKEEEMQHHCTTVDITVLLTPR